MTEAPKLPMDPLAVSVDDAAKIVGIARVTLYKLINAGDVETVKIGCRRLVKVESLRRLVGGNMPITTQELIRAVNIRSAQKKTGNHARKSYEAAMRNAPRRRE